MPTKLETFLKSRGIKPIELRRESGYSRQYLLQLRKGHQNPSKRAKDAITKACAKLARERLTVADLFGPATLRLPGKATDRRRAAREAEKHA